MSEYRTGVQINGSEKGRSPLTLIAAAELGVVEPEGPDTVAVRSQVDDPRPGAGGEDLGHDEVGEKEVPDVVRAELHLVALLVDLVFQDGHQAGIVDHDVDLLDLGVGEDRLGCAADRVLVGQLARHELDGDAVVERLDLVHDWVDLGLGTRDEDDLGRRVFSQ